MDRRRKLALIQRSLGIRHKLKVHDSMKAPDAHEDLAVMLLAKWELEDELKAIDELLAASRLATVAYKKTIFEKGENKVNYDREPRVRLSEPSSSS